METTLGPSWANSGPSWTNLGPMCGFQAEGRGRAGEGLNPEAHLPQPGAPCKQELADIKHDACMCKLAYIVHLLVLTRAFAFNSCVPLACTANNSYLHLLVDV